MDDDLRRELTACKLRTRQRSPFFSVLISYMRVVQVDENSEITTAAVDGKHLFINRKFFLSLKPVDRDFVLAHEAMHCALGHMWRKGGRLHLRWNIAGDFVINGILDKSGFLTNCSEKLKKMALLDRARFDGRSTEEVYDMLQDDVIELTWADVLEAVGPEEAKKIWSQAKARAIAVDQAYGSTPAGEWLKVTSEETGQDWRAIIWRALSKDSADFEEWDGRLVGDEIYVEALEAQLEKLRVALCVDTSGSTISVLPKFVGIVKHIAAMRKELEVSLFWADAALIGPVPLSDADKPQGGGGTSFVPFFDYLKDHLKEFDRAVYLTDLYGDFPNDPPKIDVVWAISPGGGSGPPFGKEVRIVG